MLVLLSTVVDFNITCTGKEYMQVTYYIWVHRRIAHILLGSKSAIH